MKKLLIAMTAAAVGTCAWATEGEPTTPTVTYLDESFSENWTLAGNAFWSYTGTEETELAITNVAAADATADYALALNTGSKVLTGSFASDKNPVDIGTDGLYFKSTVTFKDPSDTIPSLADGKLALFVLDNVDACETYNVEGQSPVVDPSTNLWVLAGFKGTAGLETRAFKLKVIQRTDSTGLLEQEITSTWLTQEHTIAIKAYKDVVKGDAVNGGFMVMVDGKICSVTEVHKIVDGAISWADGDWAYKTDFTNGQYLGDVVIEDGLANRFTKANLLLSAKAGAAGQKLAAVDFQGQGLIDDVGLSESDVGFGADATVVTFGGYDEDAIASITYGGQNVTDGVYTITGNENFGDTVEIVVTLKSGYALKAGNDTYTVSYTFSEATATASKTITLDVFEIKAYANGVAKRSFTEALMAALSGGGELKLEADVDSAAFGDYTYLYVESGKTLVLDLNGKTITGAGTDELPTPTIYNEGTLTIKDSSGGTGCVADSGYGAVLNSGSLSIVAGTYNGSVTTDGGTTSITGGKFLKEANATITPADGYLANGDDVTYWVVVAAPTTFAVTYEAGNFTISNEGVEFTSGNKLANGNYTFKVEATQGYKVDSVTVGGVLAQVAADGTFSVTVNGADVAIVVTTSEIVSVPTIDDTEGKITVDQTTGDATIDTTNATITVTGTVNGDVIVTPSVGTVNVTLAQDKEVKVYFDGQNISGAFTISSANGKTTIVLNENGSVNGVSVKPEMAAAGDGDEKMKAPLEVGTDVAVGVKTIPGLMYQLIRSDAPNGTFEGVGDAVEGTGAPVKLEDKNRPNGKGFYKIKVSQP